MLYKYTLNRHSEPKFFLGEESIIKLQKTGFFALLRKTVNDTLYMVYKTYEGFYD